MTAALEITKSGRANMAFAGQPGWHGLGTKVADDITPQDLMKVSGNDFMTKLFDMTAEFEGTQIKIGSKKALIRLQPDTEFHGQLLTVTGSDWKPLQNRAAFDFFDEFVKDGNMKMDTAGVIRPGNATDGTQQTWSWALAKTTEAFECVPGDRVDSYFLFANPHVYGKAAIIQHTPTRVVCWNTLSYALGETVSNRVAVAHQREFDPELVKVALGISKLQLKEYKEQAQFLASKRFNDETIKEYFDAVWPATSPKKIKTKESSTTSALFQAVMNTQPGAEFAVGTWWQAVNATTYAIDHLLGRSQDNRVYNAWFGSNRGRKDKALSLAIDYAKLSQAA